MVIPVKLPRPKVLVGITVKVATGCGNMYVQMNWHQGHVFEVFATLGHSGNCASSYSEGLTRCVTLGLRSGIPHEEFFKELRGIRCPTPMLWPKESSVLSCADAIAKVISEYGSLSSAGIIDLLKQANGNVEVPVTTSSDAEEAAAQAHLAELKQQRVQDGL